MRSAWRAAAKAGSWVSAGVLLASGAAASPYSDIYVFGDSLVDAGNIYELFGYPPVSYTHLTLPTTPYV